MNPVILFEQIQSPIETLSVQSLLLLGGVWLLISIAAAFVAYLGLPRIYRESRLAAVSMLTSMCFFVPILGAVFALLFSYVVLRVKQAPSEQEFVVTDKPSLPMRPEAEHDSVAYSLGGLSQTLKNAPELGQRQAAVTATQRLDRKDAIRHLQLALTDTEDDVSLYAYAQLDQIERDINTQIHNLRVRLEGEASSELERAELLEGLAENYWELSYLGLSVGELRNYALGEAIRYGLMSLDVMPSFSVSVLVGRAYLALQEPDKAQPYLFSAHQMDPSGLKVTPYLAEVAYQQKNYPALKRYLALHPEQKQQTPIGQVKAFWL